MLEYSGPAVVWAFWLCFKTSIYASGFGKIIVLGVDIWFCLCLIGIFFLGFCFYSGFQKSEVAMCCLLGNFMWA